MHFTCYLNALFPLSTGVAKLMVCRGYTHCTFSWSNCERQPSCLDELCKGPEPASGTCKVACNRQIRPQRCAWGRGDILKPQLQLFTSLCIGMNQRNVWSQMYCLWASPSRRFRSRYRLLCIAMCLILGVSRHKTSLWVAVIHTQLALISHLE